MGKVKFSGVDIVEQQIKKPKKAKVFCLSNQKGGVGKSTSSQAICEALCLVGYKVLAIDLDLQANFSKAADIDLPEYSGTLRQALDYMVEGNSMTKDLAHMLIGTSNGGYDIIKADLDMEKIDREFAIYPEDEVDVLLRNIVDVLKDEYHYIVIDTPPNLNLMTRNAFAAADELLIPMQANGSSTDGLGLLLRLYLEIKENYNPTLSVNGIFFTMVEERANMRDTILSMREASEDIQVKVLNQVIQKAAVYDTLRDKHVSLASTMLTDKQASQYLLLVNEILDKVLFKIYFEWS